MIRGLPTTIACACLAGAVGVGLFFIKHEVKEQEARLAELNSEIQNNQEAMHVLKAEWSYLNDPARLRALSEKHLAMKVMAPSQIASLDTLPLGNATYAAARSAAPASVAVARAEAAPAIARAEAAPAPHAAATPAATAKAPVAVAHAVAPAAAVKTSAKPAATIAAAKPAAAKAPTTVAAVKPAPQTLVPGADTTPRLAAASAPLPQPVPSAPLQRAPAAPAPARNIVIQSPALASTPGLPGEIR